MLASSGYSEVEGVYTYHILETLATWYRAPVLLQPGFKTLTIHLP